MGFSDVWNRTLVYFGIAEDEEWDEDGLETQEELEREYRSRSARQNVRRLPRRREPDGWTDDSVGVEAPPAPASSSSRTSSRPTRLRSADTGKASVHLVLPRSFNDAQQIADKFKDSVPVILNLQSADNELSKRLIDFASGLTYALNGSMQRVADKVFLLTPRNVEVSAEERARMLDKGGFFNQA
jgi:cell division inhibitor SepF